MQFHVQFCARDFMFYHFHTNIFSLMKFGIHNQENFTQIQLYLVNARNKQSLQTFHVFTKFVASIHLTIYYEQSQSDERKATI